MEKDAIKAAVLKARTFKHEIQGRNFTIVLPTDHELQVAYLKAGGTQDISAWTVMTRRLLEDAIQGWSNVSVSDLAGDDDKAAEFHVELVPLLLDAQSDWTVELSNELTTRIAMKREGVETAKKKLLTTSRG